MSEPLTAFYRWQMDLEQQKLLRGNALVGYALNVNFEGFTIATCSAMQNTAGPLSRGSFLLAMSEEQSAVVLRVREVTPSPLISTETMMLYELSKQAMPALDQMTSTEISWTCYGCYVLGAFYEDQDQVYFAGDLLRLSAANEYRVYTAGPLLPLVVNGEFARAYDQTGIFRATEFQGYSCSSSFVPNAEFRQIGTYRPTEYHKAAQFCPEVNLYLRDIAGHRTALFGKTRSGKSNTVKIIASALTRYNMAARKLGQLLIDTNGEYANDNPQDGQCLANRYPGECEVYSIRPKTGSPARVLRSNFYSSPGQAMSVFRDALSENKSTYVRAFLSVSMPTFAEIRAMPAGGERNRVIRRIQMLWAVLSKAGYPADEAAMTASAPKIPGCKSPFDPKFSKALRQKLYGGTAPAAPDSLNALCTELEKLFALYQKEPKCSELQSTSGNPLLDADDVNILKFLNPGATGAGVRSLSACRYLHDSAAGDIFAEIPDFLDQCKTVILDMSNASPAVIRYITSEICTTVFQHQETLFTDNKLGDHFVQLYVEEAHNYFPSGDKQNTDIYSRIAKEGAKYNIGLVYSTQSPSTISGELLSQTENFVVAHLDSSHEVDALSKRSAPFSGVRENILRARTPGYVYLMTASQRYPIPVQIRSFRDEEVQ